MSLLLNHDSPRARQPAPETSNINLTMHQCAMLHKCQEIENNQEESGIEYPYLVLGSKPGSGKSYVILSYILSEKLRYAETDSSPINILVVPANLYAQWTTYFNEYYKNIYTIDLNNPGQASDPNVMSILYIPNDTSLMQLRYNFNSLAYANIILIPTIL